MFGALRGSQRALVVLLMSQAAGLVLNLLAGGAILAHVSPYNKCVLFSQETETGGLEYGDPAYCEALGYLYVLTCLPVLASTYILLRQIGLISNLAHHVSATGLKSLKIGDILVSLHLATLATVVSLTVTLTLGYSSSCHSFQTHVERILDNELDKDPVDLRGATIEDRFSDNIRFWRYIQVVGSPWGASTYSVQTSCRTLFTDPDISTALHKTHVAKFNTYFSYWFKEDIFQLDPQAAAVSTNLSLEASLAGAWLGALLWLGATIFLLATRRRMNHKSRRNRLGSVKTTSPNRLDSSMATTSNRPRHSGGTHNFSPSPCRVSSRGELDSLALDTFLSSSSSRAGSQLSFSSSGARKQQQSPDPRGPRLPAPGPLAPGHAANFNNCPQGKPLLQQHGCHETEIL